jgi:hypothetical protein
MATSFSGGGSRREPSTLGKQLVSFITCDCESSAPFFVIYKAGRLRHFRLYKVHSYLLTVLNTGFLQSDQVQRYIYKINWLSIKVLKTATSSKSINLYLYRLRVKCALFCNLQSWARTHAILVIGLYELLDPTTHPGPGSVGI